MAKEYKPRDKKHREFLVRGLEIVNSVPYKVSARWLFYRLLQEGFYTCKKDYDRMFTPLIQARKRFSHGWRPDTLADETREAIIRTGGDESVEALLERWSESLWIGMELDHFYKQPHYIELWFEAEAMVGQFKHYTDGITLVPFRGDASIPFKWEMAKRIEEMYYTYAKPVVILYFGDCDDKGEEIPENALRDVRQWCKVGFDFHVCGLTMEQVERFNLPENPERPGQYQWEALSDDQAREIIEDNVYNYINHGAITVTENQIEKAEEEWNKKIREFIKGEMTK